MLGDGLPRTATPDGAEARREGRRLAGCVQPARLEETPEAVVDEAQAVRRVRRKLTEDNRRRRDEPGSAARISDRLEYRAPVGRRRRWLQAYRPTSTGTAARKTSSPSQRNVTAAVPSG